MAEFIVTSLEQWSASWGAGFYVFLFLLIFAETGLVIVPFLPGDSVLLAVGALASRPGEPVDLMTAGVVMCVAAIVGDSTNYWVGRHLGPRLFSSDKSRFLNKKHVKKAQDFYAKHGGKTVILCRFLVIIRTFAPFVAGMGSMLYPKFVAYSVLGTLLWVWSFLFLGFWLGQEFADKVDYVVYGILLFAFVPPTISKLRQRRALKRASSAATGGEGS